MYFYAIKDLGFNLLPSARNRGLQLSTILCIIFLCFNSSNSYGQFYEYGQDAGSVKWNHFSSDHYQLIFPRGLDTLAMHFADKLEYFYPFQADALKHEHGKMPVIVHNEASFSNGVFVWAPKRLEIFTNPDPNGYPQDWLTQLAIHEGRHAVQVSKLNQGFSKGLSYIAGEQAVGAITGFLPMWYLEGDAVDAETRFSQTGRGRMPSFEMGMKAQLLEKKEYSFSKALLGSYKDYVPNHYELGYLLVRHGKRKYGNNLWIDMEDYAARKPYLISPTYFSMLKYGVKSKRSFYLEALEEYATHWRKNRNNRTINPHETWSQPKENFFSNYHFSQWVSDSTLVVLKSGLDQIPEFVELNSRGEEKRIFRPGYMNSGRFSMSGQFLVWDEWVPDVRWSNRNYSVIRMLDMNTGKVKSLGSRTRYYAPALSNSGKQIVSVEQKTDHSFNLVVLDFDGSVIKSVPSPGNKYIQHPTWMENDTAILVTLNDLEGEFLYTYSLKGDQWREIFHSGFNDISFPLVRAADIYFSGTFSGIDNIYCFNTDTDSLFMVTSAEFGAFEPAICPSGTMISYSDYHSNGYHAATSVLEKSNWIPRENIPPRTEQMEFESSETEMAIIKGEQSIVPGDYSPVPYNKALNSVHPHSWLPLYFDYLNPEAALSPEEFPVSLGATLLSQNLLSTVTGMLGYEYKDKFHYLHTGVTFKGKFPIFNLRMDYGGYPSVFIVDSNDSIAVKPNRLSISSSVYFPVRFNTGKFITFLQPRVGWSYSSDIFYNPDYSSYFTGSHRLNYQLFFTSYLRTNKRDILPRLGFTAIAFYQHAPFDKPIFGDIFSYSGSLNVPGPLRHQTIKLKYSHQIQHPGAYWYNNSIAIPRGTFGLLGKDITMFSLDYTLPLLYPDLSIEPLIYLKRIRANIWGDYLVGKEMNAGSGNPLEDQVHSSYGFDLLFDFHPIRMFFPFAMGGRFAYLPGTKELNVEFLFNIDI